MDKKRSIILYPADFLAVSARLRKHDVGNLIIAICEHNLFGKARAALTENTKDGFALIQSDIDLNNAKYAEICAKRKACGSKGGRNKKANASQMVLPQQLSGQSFKPCYESEEENDPVFIENKKREADAAGKSSGLSGPSVEEVAAYCRSGGYGIDPTAFVRWNAERGWMNGKKYIGLDWRRAVRKWHCKENGLIFNEMETMPDLCGGILDKIKGGSHDGH